MSAKSWASGIKKSSDVAGLVLWVAVVFIGTQIVVGLLYSVLQLTPLLSGVNQFVSTTLYAAVSYSLAGLIAIGIPWWLLKKPTPRKQLGIDRLPDWRDIGAMLLAILPYILLTALFAGLASNISGFNADQEQALPFSSPSLGIEFAMAFITLVIVAPLAEELLFRGYLQGRVAVMTNPVIAVIVSALVFGAMHLPGNTEPQWGVAIDTLALGLVLGVLRNHTGSIWAGVLLHALKNGVAFYFLFIYPLILGML